MGKMDMDTPENGGAFGHRGAIELPPCFFLGEAVERRRRGKTGKKPSQSPSVTALPKGEPRGCTPLHFSPLSGRVPASLSLSSAVR